jgi:ubiquitin carboxyl-terminal hydrolase 22/27/51
MRGVHARAPRRASASLLTRRPRCRSGNCKAHHQTTKQFSVEELPLVLVLHLKRFEHVSAAPRKQRASTKITTFVRFPERLDMAPYTFAAQRDKADRGGGGGGGDDDDGGASQYELFAVIVHFGAIDNGHYVCFVRKDRSWFRCDDTAVTPVALETVLQHQGYLLFYIRSRIPRATWSALLPA